MPFILLKAWLASALMKISDFSALYMADGGHLASLPVSRFPIRNSRKGPREAGDCDSQLHDPSSNDRSVIGRNHRLHVKQRYFAAPAGHPALSVRAALEMPT